MTKLTPEQKAAETLAALEAKITEARQIQKDLAAECARVRKDVKDQITRDLVDSVAKLDAELKTWCENRLGSIAREVDEYAMRIVLSAIHNLKEDSAFQILVTLAHVAQKNGKNIMAMAATMAADPPPEVVEQLARIYSSRRKESSDRPATDTGPDV
jgi:hypothetical protein